MDPEVSQSGYIPQITRIDAEDQTLLGSFPASSEAVCFINRDGHGGFAKEYSALIKQIEAEKKCPWYLFTSPETSYKFFLLPQRQHMIPIAPILLMSGFLVVFTYLSKRAFVFFH
jgi:hypothetical protein